MEGDRPMPDEPPVPPATQDFSDHWGFYLLQAINRLDDKIDNVRREQERTADSLRQEIRALDAKVEQKIEGLDTKFEQKIDGLDNKFDQKLTNLQYWYWGTLIVIIIGFVTVLFTRP